MAHEQNSRNTITAFLTALANQQHPGSPALIAELHNLGQQLHNDSDFLQEPSLFLEPILDRYPELNVAYLEAGRQIHLQEKKAVKKDGPTPFAGISKNGLINTVKVVFTDTDPIAAAQKEQFPVPHPLQKIKQLFGFAATTK
jgi:hypothetical protein